MKRLSTLTAVAFLCLLASACTSSADKPQPAASAPELTGTIEFWHFFSDREASAVEGIIAGFKAKYPKVTVNITAGQDDAKTLQSIGAGEGPDVAISYSTDVVGKFCATNVWQDLNLRRRTSVRWSGRAGSSRTAPPTSAPILR